MKKEYSDPEIRAVKFDIENVVTASGVAGTYAASATESSLADEGYTVGSVLFSDLTGYKVTW